VGCIKLVQDRVQWQTEESFRDCDCVPSVSVHVIRSHVVILLLFLIEVAVLCSKLCCLKDESVTW
jgi:hypothetical protein